jgi:uncharacterized protein YrzB (UPF0473 family)
MEDNKIQFEDDDIITMIGEDGTEIDFVELADIVYKDGYYVVAQPLKAFDGIDEDACLVFKVEENGEVVDRMKFVRYSFLQTVEESATHWLDRTIIPNKLGDKNGENK